MIKLNGTYTPRSTSTGMLILFVLAIVYTSKYDCDASMISYSTFKAAASPELMVKVRRKRGVIGTVFKTGWSVVKKSDKLLSKLYAIMTVMNHFPSEVREAKDNIKAIGQLVGLDSKKDDIKNEERSDQKELDLIMERLVKEPQQPQTSDPNVVLSTQDSNQWYQQHWLAILLVICIVNVIVFFVVFRNRRQKTSSRYQSGPSSWRKSRTRKRRRNRRQHRTTPVKSSNRRSSAR